jgi:inner membrane transporter RhtA
MRYFAVSATFHYLGPAFAVLLFARVDVLGVAWLRIATAAVIFAAWRRPWRRIGRADGRLVLAWGGCLALMNCCFYLAIDRLPLATVAAIEFLPVIALAAAGARSRRNLAALALAVAGVYALTGVHLGGGALPLGLAFANAALFAAYIVLADRVAKRPQLNGIDGLGAAMLVAAVVVTPLAGWAAAPALVDATALLAGVDGRAAAGDRDGDRDRRPRADPLRTRPRRDRLRGGRRGTAPRARRGLSRRC